MRTVENSPGPPPVPLGPAPAGTLGLPSMSPARRDLLELLARQPGPVTVTELATMSEQRPNTIREHLDGLVGDGLAVRTRGAARGRGRPPWRYEYTDPVGLSTGNEYAALAIALAEHIERTSTDPARDARTAGEVWGDSMLRLDRARSARGRHRKVIDSLDALGFAPEVSEDGTARLVRCPLLAAARRSPTVVCGVHQGLLRAAMRTQGLAPDDVTLDPFAAPGCCLVSFQSP